MGVKGAANLKVQLIVQNFCMHFNFEFWRKNSKLRCMQNFKNKLYLEMTIPFGIEIDIPDLSIDSLVVAVSIATLGLSHCHLSGMTNVHRCRLHLVTSRLRRL